MPPEQEKSHANGMSNFFHHVVALAGLWFDLNDLVPVEAAWAKYPDARVPDTYGAAQFKGQCTSEVVVSGAVGKYMEHPRKVIYLEGTKGKAWIRQDENKLFAYGKDGLRAHVQRSEYDSGYGNLIAAIANGGPLPSTLLTYERALQVLRLVETAHNMAEALEYYPDGRSIVFG